MSLPVRIVTDGIGYGIGHRAQGIGYRGDTSLFAAMQIESINGIRARTRNPRNAERPFILQSSDALCSLPRAIYPFRRELYHELGTK
jgi:hypothetical protein